MTDSREKIYPWGHGRRFNAYSNWFRTHFGGRLQKVSIDAGFTCPNRDGTKGTGGCTFCNNDSFNPSYCLPSKTVTEQLNTGIDFLEKRYSGAVAFLAYFQAYSNTYDSLDKLKKLYGEALAHPRIAGLIIGTRPDCIDTDKISYFRELSEKYFIAVEYGVESCYNKTLSRINRGHTFEDAVEAIALTSAAGIRTGAHFIIGLPGETREEMLNMADIISSLPVHSVKFHQLQIIKGTAIEKEFSSAREDFTTFSFTEYADFFIEILERLNPSIVVERFSGEAPPSMLAYKGWGGKRSEEVVRLMEKRMEELDTWQGKKFKGQ
jgi:radical SAM protein (TIGR01212 family)